MKTKSNKEKEDETALVMAPKRSKRIASINQERKRDEEMVWKHKHNK